ncbi:MAG: HEAT repeat domain-containing protein [Verrucomicrobia bacterium]|nr:HEAT repeat domain-containing protein [Verrucomicrobiota bacterium]
MLTVCLLATLVAGTGFFVWRSREPDYQDKRLSAWLENFSPGNSHASWLEGREALLQMGTGALPFLLENLGSTDSRLRLFLMSWAQRQRVVKVRFRPAYYRRFCARRAFEALGLAAKPAVTQLAQMAERRTEDVRIRSHALAILRGLGPEANESVPFLIKILEAEGDDMEIKSRACEVLGAIGPAADGAIQTLVNALDDKGNGSLDADEFSPLQNGQPLLLLGSRQMRLFAAAARALGKIGPAAKAVVPALLEGLSEDDPETRQAAEQAVKRIDPKTSVDAILRQRRTPPSPDIH